MSIFRDVSSVDETRVSFKLYPIDLPEEGLSDTRPVVRRLKTNEVLFAKGSVWMEIDIPPRGCFVWEGNSADPMGDDIRGSRVFEFMKI